MPRSYSRSAASICSVLVAFHLLIALHELGHATIARTLGYRVRSIILGAGPLLCRTRIRGIQLEVHPLPLMGYTELRPGGSSRSLPRTLSLTALRRRVSFQELTILFAGPLFSLLLGSLLLAGYLVAHRGRFAASDLDAPGDLGRCTGILCLLFGGWKCFRHSPSAAVLYSATCSLTLGLTNLLPIPPMDGGYMALELVQVVSGKRLPPDTVALTTGLGVLLLFLASLCFLVADGRFLWRRFSLRRLESPIPAYNGQLDHVRCQNHVRCRSPESCT